MFYLSTDIKNFNNIPDDCKIIVFMNELNFDLINLPPSCKNIILTKDSLLQLKYLKKLPFNCIVKCNDE
jgi:hypothetical protein